MTLSYIEPLYRPPSEANSLILQVTNGCSWNHCAFCEMYTSPQKRFSITKSKNIHNLVKSAAEDEPETRRIFLADGDALVLSTRRLLEILESINQHFSKINRVSAYCLPRNIRSKSVNEMKELQDAGLKLVYVGAESGDDELLKIINKGESQQTTINSLQKLSQANIKTSVMILNGLGGKQYSQQHAINSAHMINEIQPNYLATLVISFPLGEERFRSHFPTEFLPLNQNELFREMEKFIQLTDLKNTIFRSDHASNYLSLKGILGKDKENMLNILNQAIHTPELLNLRPEWMRGL